MKYIMLRVKRGKELSRLVPIIFPSFLVHKEVTKAIVNVLKRDDFEVELVSGGDYNSIIRTCSCSSEILKLKSNPEDARVILMYDYEHGFL